MMGMRVAVSRFSFRSAICCRIPLAAMCRVVRVHLSKKHDVSSMAKISSGESERLYSLMSRASNSNQGCFCVLCLGFWENFLTEISHNLKSGLSVNLGGTLTCQSVEI